MRLLLKTLAKLSNLFFCQVLKQFGEFPLCKEPVVVLVKVLKSLNISHTSNFKFVRLDKPQLSKSIPMEPPWTLSQHHWSVQKQLLLHRWSLWEKPFRTFDLDQSGLVRSFPDRWPKPCWIANSYLAEVWGRAGDGRRVQDGLPCPAQGPTCNLGRQFRWTSGKISFNPQDKHQC